MLEVYSHKSVFLGAQMCWSDSLNFVIFCHIATPTMNELYLLDQHVVVEYFTVKGKAFFSTCFYKYESEKCGMLILCCVINVKGVKCKCILYFTFLPEKRVKTTYPFLFTPK